MRRCASACSVLLLAAIVLVAAIPRRADAQAAAAAVVRGTVTTLAGEVLLPGATLRLERSGATANAAEAVNTVSDERGRFRFAGLAAGTYRLTAVLTGFVALERDVIAVSGTETDVNVDLRIQGVSETIVVAPSPQQVEAGASLGSSERIDFAHLQAESAGEVEVGSVLQLVPGVIHGPAGVSVKGGRPTQSGLQMGTADLADPATGESDVWLPKDAIASIEVLPNPYAAEFGRFTSGLTLLQTRKGGDAWRVSVAGIHPVFRTERGHPWHIIGVQAFRPRLSFGGRLFGGRVSIAQSFQYRFTSQDIQSRPQAERSRDERAGSATRIDATVAPGHLLQVTIAASPENERYATLGTFDPPEVTASTRTRRYDAVVSEEWAVAPATFMESLLHVKRRQAWVTGEGALPMEIRPEARAGSYFNNQTRDVWSIQWRETLSGVRQGLAGSHFYKAGIDLASEAFDGTDVNRPVDIRRADGTLAERIEFEHGTAQRVRATGFAAFVQDRWQATKRVLLEAGIRIDRDGVARSSTASPRLGVKVSLLPQDRLSVSAGVGRFVERVPLTLGAFGSFDTRVVTSYAADGSPLGPPVRDQPRIGASGLDAPRALTWHVESELKVSPALSLRGSVLSRRGTREHVVIAEGTAGAGSLSVDSRGRSSYREFALSARYVDGPRLFASASYVRSAARGDTNAYTSFFGTIRDPVIRANAYARADTDVPNRLVAQARGQIGRWRLASVFECRDGLPYSAVDERQAYVGVPNAAGRLPLFVTWDVAFERQLRLGSWKPWVGAELTNLLNRFNPRDVQRNIDASDAGYLYNSIPRRALLTIKF
jgi:hypothetical protein